jgi:hypothetical protein
MALLNEAQVGDYVDYVLGEERDPVDRRVRVTRSVAAEIVALTDKRVTIRLVGYPRLRARSLKRSSWRIRW